MNLEERVRRLEDDRAIRDLKARYLRACDLKQPGTVRDCLLPGVRIAYEGFPLFDNREDFVAIYEQMGCQPHIFDIHHGANGVISFSAEDRATGQWALTFHNIDLVGQTITQFGIEYDDVYLRKDNRWWIAETVTRRRSVLIQQVDDAGNAKVIALGDGGPAFAST